MRLILVRHGETEQNAANIVQGHVHGCLSARGIRQAQSVAGRLKDMPIDAVYSSDLDRAKETARIIAGRLPGVPCFEDTRLREQNFGVFEERPIVDLLDRMNLENKDFATFTPDGGESRTDFQRRVMGFFQETRTGHNDKTVLLVTHYGVINILLGGLLEDENPLSTDWRIANGSITILAFDHGGGPAYPEAVNTVDHLAGESPVIS